MMAVFPSPRARNQMVSGYRPCQPSVCRSPIWTANHWTRVHTICETVVVMSSH
jgi:hypothetical protein